jgi:hypothetical protein
MEVSYERTGGFAGMRMAASFNLDELPEQDAQSIRDCLHQAHFHTLPERITSPGQMPDQFTYKITVTSGESRHTVTTGDAPAPPELRQVIELLNQLARARGRG